MASSIQSNSLTGNGQGKSLLAGHAALPPRLLGVRGQDKTKHSNSPIRLRRLFDAGAGNSAWGQCLTPFLHATSQLARVLEMSVLADRFKERFRIKLKRWIDRERAHLGCATAAVKKVASALGKHPTWVWGHVNRHPKPMTIRIEHYAVACLPKLFKSVAGKAKALNRQVPVDLNLKERELA